MEKADANDPAQKSDVTKPGKRKGSGSLTTEDAAKSVSPKPSPSAPSAGEGGPRTGEGQRTPLRAQLSPRPLGDPDSFQPSPCHLGGRAWGVATSSQGSDLACRLRLQRSIVSLHNRGFRNPDFHGNCLNRVFYGGGDHAQTYKVP